MPRKKSVQAVTDGFKEEAAEIVEYAERVASGLGKADASRVYDGAIIGLYRAFERMILECMVAAFNQDTKAVSETLEIDLPRHLREDLCRFLITGPSYFDFKGRSGLIGRLKQYLPASHYLVKCVKKPTYTTSLDRLCALRNFAAHGSPQSKRAAAEAVGLAKIGSAGSWLKSQGRLPTIQKKVSGLADDIASHARF